MSEQFQGDSVVEILDELIDIVNNGRAIPMSASVMINRSEVLDLLKAARDAVPEQVVQADSVLADVEGVRTKGRAQATQLIENAQEHGNKIVHEARSEAEQILSEARNQAARLVSDDAITVAARSQAQRIVDEAKAKAQKLQEGANRYSDQSLARLQDNLVSVGQNLEDIVQRVNQDINQALAQVYKGRNVLAQRSTANNSQAQPSATMREGGQEA